MKSPISVGARDLKTRLGTYLRRVRAGQRIVVTDRGTPVAELRGLDEGTEGRLARLHAAGLVTAATRPSLAPLRAVTARKGTAPLSVAVVEGREERL